MARYTETVAARVRLRYENTDQTLTAIGAEFGISGRSVSRMANEYGWQKRSERVRDVPVAIQLLEEAKGLATQACHSREGGNPVIAEAKSETPELLGPRLRGDDKCERSDAPLTQPLSPIDRLEALVVKQIEAEEIKRSLYAGKRRAKTTDDRCARTLATLTQTLHALQRLRAGENPEHETANDDFDDMPRDLDEFRRDLARRIDAFVASRADGSDAGRDADAAPLDEAG